MPNLKDDLEGIKNPRREKIHSVYFNTCTPPNSTPNHIDVKDGEAIGKFKAPTKPDCDFVGWYADREHKSPYDLESPVFADITIYAKWACRTSAIKKIKHTITFCDYDDSSTVDVFHGATVDRPRARRRLGYVFLGWYLIDAPVEAFLYLFDTPVTEGLIFWAMWEPAPTPFPRKGELE